jgi:hydroxymethylpyrimidine pyrophosphatase-like HAD family hydrolase
MIIAVEFDGTIVENKHPGIGKERPLAIHILKELQIRGHKIILWTRRSEDELHAAVEYCLKEGLEFDAVNNDIVENKKKDCICKKVEADLYIDCRNAGGTPNWNEIFWTLHPEEYNQVKLRNSRKKKSGIFKYINNRN